jgi:hypothetical protein
LIGIHWAWHDEPLPEQLAGRFAASLGLAVNKPAALYRHGGRWFAATAAPRGWIPLRLPGGERLLFSGHISNRSELRRELGPCGPGDTALYAAAYATWGDNADLKVIGQFATIVTAADAPRLRLSRSPITAPPLSYYNDAAARLSSAARHPPGRSRSEKTSSIARCSQLLRRSARLPHRRGAFRRHRVVLTPDGHGPNAITTWPLFRMCAAHRRRSEEARRFSEATAAALDGFSRPAISLSGG